MLPIFLPSIAHGRQIVVWGVKEEGCHGFPQRHAWRAIVIALPVLLEQRDEELALVVR